MSVGDGKRKLLLSIPLVAALLLVQIGPMNMRTDTYCMHCHTSIHTGRVQLGGWALALCAVLRTQYTLLRNYPGLISSTRQDATLAKYGQNRKTQRSRLQDTHSSPPWHSHVPHRLTLTPFCSDFALQMIPQSVRTHLVY
ncbi:hypothetical protein CABS01_01457 [Colletotrichum abscissum]|uniref:Uncharacterized protein n=2 Tax=Colletotrichum acutatum species complex TaxID=2707335 RepID=A0AAI9YW38_9PEZI|nr:uncharacterized protein CCOS01_08664 [Colletotrichum costaricense]XP_060385369.1 uncharacterized protein CTAM01_03918 [Colletotrichum tamarilloi]XP_060398026.1 uncharacterized protein CABS01_01457 [Colletotrichum abscissum]KAK1495650.1 hypothetical protein CABS01_01457 [Colletotrichum abscissum]KAK1504611.1 hypothetical protein CTAM01_03918 [Colletotrichum tamarilloi]KAK1526246.1 hypothetical protein CCOS01_08664 [Colletotrichum costaricense]